MRREELEIKLQKLEQMLNRSEQENIELTKTLWEKENEITDLQELLKEKVIREENEIATKAKKMKKKGKKKQYFDKKLKKKQKTLKNGILNRLAATKQLPVL